MAESLLAALMLGSANASPGLYAYLVAPPVLAGVRHGAVTTVNVAFLGSVGLLSAVAASTDSDPRGVLVAAGPWMLSGLGAGLLASWQSRAIRDQESRRAPYEAAHQLMERLHHLTRAGSLGLDAASLAEDLDAAMRRATGCARSTTFITDPSGAIRTLNGKFDVGRLEQELHVSDDERTPGAAVIPLRGAQHVLGHCVLVGVPRWTPELDERAQLVADEFAVRLDTAVLFDEVRTIATSEERNRIAREMHDGVAQELVALGYVVDEIESVSDDPRTQELASSLRAEISRVVAEIRYSIYDLRQHVTERRFSGALAEYVRELSTGTGLQVHLDLDETGTALSSRIETELLRIAQEAIGNVRRHAQATNLWVTFVTDGVNVDLHIDDDGLGGAATKDHHWGLQSMAERAAVIGATLTVQERATGGTSVHLTTDHSTAAPERTHA